MTVSTGENGLSIRLNEQNGVEITSGGRIQIRSGHDLTLNSEARITVTGSEAIELKCRNSGITLDGIARITGERVDKGTGGTT